ncbi:MAG: 2-succinyl-5-enolpyruvyl-6-hydroxy-3-cyclohexene-1-carboxylic-acid synthase [Flavobacteriaceae bacterium]
MKHSSIPSARTVVLHCKARGIKNVVISPGSRNAPLIIGFSEDPYFNCMSIVDERCAAFFGMGMAQFLREPVALLCTSGSALLNYYPAIAEAYYSQIPLVVISADRPEYKIDVGDGQTIRQDHVFDRHIGYSANLKQDLVHALDRIKQYRPKWLENKSLAIAQKEVQHYNDDELNTAFEVLLTLALPIHINVPFEEPLYGFKSDTEIEPMVMPLESEKIDASTEFETFAGIWNAASKKMVLVGVNPPNTTDHALMEILAKDPTVVVFTETTSNLHHPDFFPSIDSIIAPMEKSELKDELFEKLRPDVLVTFGGMVVSKKIKAFLRQYGPKHHWHIDCLRAFDTYFCLSHHFKCSANAFFKGLFQFTAAGKGDYFKYWNSIKIEGESKRDAYLKQIPFSDLLAFHQVLKGIPENLQLQLSNSSTVRYAQLFKLHPSLRVFSNRGTSGIDGSTSTAIGAAYHCKEPTLLITGDLSFFYDGNALWNKYIRPDFRIILVNNGGGGIFRILPGKEDTEKFETFFETTHGLDASQLCEMHGLGYQVVSGAKELESTLDHFYSPSPQPQLLEIKTPRLLNNKILLAYFDFISSFEVNINP